jgi:hypothetical protein
MGEKLLTSAIYILVVAGGIYVMASSRPATGSQPSAFPINSGDGR